MKTTEPAFAHEVDLALSTVIRNMKEQLTQVREREVQWAVFHPYAAWHRVNQPL
jgi:hypothetical protein